MTARKQPLTHPWKASGATRVTLSWISERTGLTKVTLERYSIPNPKGRSPGFPDFPKAVTHRVGTRMWNRDEAESWIKKWKEWKSNRTLKKGESNV